MDTLAIRQMKKALAERKQLKVEIQMSREIPPTFKVTPVK